MSGPLGTGSGGGGGGGGGGGVTSLVAGSGISVSSSTGAVTVTSSGATLISRLTLPATAATFSINNIPSGYKHLEIIYALRSDRTSAAIAIARIAFNGDDPFSAATNYTSNNFAQAYFCGPIVPTATCLSGFGTGKLFLHNAGDTTSLTDMVLTNVSFPATTYRGSSGNATASNWNNTARVTDISFSHIPTGNFFVAGSTVEVWGYP